MITLKDERTPQGSFGIPFVVLPFPFYSLSSYPAQLSTRILYLYITFLYFPEIIIPGSIRIAYSSLQPNLQVLLFLCLPAFRNCICQARISATELGKWSLWAPGSNYRRYPSSSQEKDAVDKVRSISWRNARCGGSYYGLLQ